MKIDLIIKNGTIYTAEGPIKAGIAIDDEKIVAIANEDNLPDADMTIDASQKIILPGLIDVHVHLRDPGYNNKEDFTTGTMAAAAGGITFVSDMPNVNPPLNTLEQFIKHRKNAEGKAIVDFSHNPSGTRLEEISKLAKECPLSYKIFQMSDIGREYPHMPGIGIDDDGTLLQLFKEIAKTGICVQVHPWNQSIWNIVTKEYWNKGKFDASSYGRAVREYNSIIFDSAISSLLFLQEASHVKLHILHVSSKRGIDMIEKAKAHGHPVTYEINPHDVFLYNKWSNIERLGPYALGWYVPETDGLETWKALVDGRADIIATDHAPHTKEEKEIGWENMWKAPGGTPALEWYLSLFLTEVNKGRLPLERLVQLTSENPAKIFQIYPRKGTIKVGSDADLVLIDMNKKDVLREDKMYSKCGWNPYSGMEIKGMPVQTIVRGNVVMKDGEVFGKPGYGKYIRSTPKALQVHES
jgi:dihydroorotase (multifunctional complex type)